MDKELKEKDMKDGLWNKRTKWKKEIGKRSKLLEGKRVRRPISLKTTLAQA